MANSQSNTQARATGLADLPRSVLRGIPNKLLQPAVHAPFMLKKLLAAKLLLHVFRDNLDAGDLDFLIGRWMKLEVSDVGLSLQFSCSPDRKVLVRKLGASAVCIRGDLKSFVYLAARKEDPDTLFFQRDLVIEGDTDLGLGVKNLMDGLDLDVLPPELRFLLKGGAEYMDAFC